AEVPETQSVVHEVGLRVVTEARVFVFLVLGLVSDGQTLAGQLRAAQRAHSLESKPERVLERQCQKPSSVTIALAFGPLSRHRVEMTSQEARHREQIGSP